MSPWISTMNFGGRRLVPLVPHFSLVQFNCIATWTALPEHTFALRE